MMLAFDETKATQTAARFLKLAGAPMNYMALIKLLYKADREALRRWGLPITTDKDVSIRRGPVTSRIYDRIKASASKNTQPTIWSSYIYKTDVLSVGLASDPGDSELSPAEERLIDEIFAVDGRRNRFDLVEDCHRDFPEWVDPGDSSIPLHISEIIEALGLSESEAAFIERQIEGQRAAYQLAV